MHDDEPRHGTGPPDEGRTTPYGGHPPSAEPVGQSVGRFEILGELGRGGMGVVYRARDPRLERDVALKFLSGFLTDDPTARRRFITEAKAASSLDHPNICTIHEIGETPDDRVYIAMSYYPGETLKERLSHGPASLGELLGLGVQVCRGLAKAHERGIVHRDIKPGNIMVTSDGVVKILDFGTAKVGDLELTRAGSPIGTVTYMSPEQARGDRVDARSDLWSLGAVLYEMASGRPPFQAGHPAAVANFILSKDPPALADVASVPAELARTVHRCLAKDPDDRYASVQALAVDLVRIAREEGVDLHMTGTGTQVERPAARSSHRRRRLAGAALLLATGLVAWPVTRQPLLEPFGLRSGRTYLAVVPFTPGDNVVATGLTLSLTSMIAQLAGDDETLGVAPARDVIRLAVTDPRAAWRAFRATTVVEGAVGPEGSVTLNLIETDGERSRVVRSSHLPDPADAAFLPEARVALASFLGIGIGASGRLVSTEAAVRADAYPFYVQGLGYLERYYDRRNLELAETLFRRALQEDPAYAPAHAGLCRAIWEQYLSDRDMTLARSAAAECDRAADLAADDPTVLIPLAAIYLATGLHDRAAAVLKRALELSPDNADAYRGLGGVYEDQGRTEDAEAAYRRAIALRPDLWFNYDALGMLVLFDGRPSEAAQLFEHVGLLAPDNHLADVMLGVARMQGDEFAQADSVLRRSIAKVPDAIAYRNLGHLYLLQARFEDAIRELETGLGLAESDWYSWRLLGQARYWAGDRTGAEADWRRYVPLAEERLAVNPNDVEALGGLAEVHAALGDSSEARSYLEKLGTLPLKWNLIDFYAGRAHEMLGQRDAALPYIENALAQGLRTSWLVRDPWLADLREDRRFAALMERYSGR